MSPIRPDGPITGQTPQPIARNQRAGVRDTGSFDRCLQSQILSQAGIKLSAHAQQRLAERNVSLDASEGARIRTAVDKMAEKGADRSLVLMDDLALVVSARNRVVITAVDAATAREGVFTNIEGAVII